jgi:pyruvate formate lyase activating enzyme
MEASFYHIENGKLRCTLCPHRCLIANKQAGICRVRRNLDSILVAETYGKIVAIHPDPIEKKPLYHFYPGRNILSIGTVGCNLRCSFCQNCDISQIGVHEFSWTKEYTVNQLIKEAASIPNNLGIAFTYNEPTIFYEFMLDVAKATQPLGYKNVMITNGFIEKEPLLTLLPFIDAFNVDLKAFNDSFYQKQTHSHLEPVKQTLINIKKTNKHVEITNLIIPGLNDTDKEFKSMIEWIYNELGKNTILHLSKYFPRYQMTSPATEDSTLSRLFEIANSKLDYVYLGNVGSHLEGHDTKCAHCKSVIIKRSGYSITTPGMSADGTCIKCSHTVAINS